MKATQRADPAHCSHSGMTQGRSVHHHSTADSTTHMQSWIGTDAPTQGDSGNSDELAEAGWGTGGQGVARHRTCTSSRRTTKVERAVKEAILGLAVNSPGQLCTHWIDVGVRAPVAERYTSSGKQVVACATHGRGGQVEALQE